MDDRNDSDLLGSVRRVRSVLRDASTSMAFAAKFELKSRCARAETWDAMVGLRRMSARSAMEIDVRQLGYFVGRTGEGSMTTWILECTRARYLGNRGAKETETEARATTVSLAPYSVRG